MGKFCYLTLKGVYENTFKDAFKCVIFNLNIATLSMGIGSDRLINELKDAFDRLDEIERGFVEVAPGLLHIVKRHEVFLTFDLDELSFSTSTALGIIERRGSAIHRLVASLITMVSNPYMSRRVIPCAVTGVVWTEKAKHRKEIQNNITALTRLKLKLSIFKALNIDRIFQFIEPRFHHSNFKTGF